MKKYLMLDHLLKSIERSIIFIMSFIVTLHLVTCSFDKNLIVHTILLTAYILHLNCRDLFLCNNYFLSFFASRLVMTN
jgi:hypothetical protein